jgi:competence transcription factor ComK
VAFAIFFTFFFPLFSKTYFKNMFLSIVHIQIYTNLKWGGYG